MTQGYCTNIRIFSIIDLIIKQTKLLNLNRIDSCSNFFKILFLLFLFTLHETKPFHSFHIALPNTMPLQILSNPIHFYGNLYRVKNRHNNKPVKYLGSRILPPSFPQRSRGRRRAFHARLPSVRASRETKSRDK